MLSHWETRVAVPLGILAIAGTTVRAQPVPPPLSLGELACRDAAGFNARGDFTSLKPARNAIEVCEEALMPGTHPDVKAYLGRALYFSERYGDARRMIEQAHATQSSLGHCPARGCLRAWIRCTRESRKSCRILPLRRSSRPCYWSEQSRHALQRGYPCMSCVRHTMFLTARIAITEGVAARLI